MPANLTPDYKAAEQRYREAKTNEDKLAALEEMLRVMPKHKGTDHLQADVKARIAKLKRQPKKKEGRRIFSYTIPREGAGQIALVGPPNTGKSSLVAALTKARPEIADYPFTTHEPTPGMMPFQDIAFQLVDLPPLSQDHAEPWLFDLLRRADLFWLVVDGSNPLAQFEDTERSLSAKNIGIYPPQIFSPPPGGVGWTFTRALLVVTGADRPGAHENVDVLNELLEGRWPPVLVSPVTGKGLGELGQRSFEALEILRVYTKQPGKKPDLDQPFTLTRGATVAELATKIHKEVSEKLKFARIWGSGVFDGQVVQRSHVLTDGDVVELHL